MLEKEYKDWVLSDYDRKREAGQLPSELVSPTPGGLKTAGIRASEAGFKTKDEVLLRSFFGQRANPAEYRKAVHNSSADLFRPLNNFLKDRSIRTSPRNIDLLAWLIDFEPRPFRPDLVRKQTVGSTVELAEEESFLMQVQTGEQNTPVEAGQKLPGKIRKVLAAIVFLVLAAVLTGYFVFSHNAGRVNGDEGCMIWDGDHYQPVYCNDKTLQQRPSPIDHQLVDHFKKIARPDTLTPRSLGKVWYAKYNGRVEFFTSGGYYPLDTNRRLLPMTDHILEKYVYHITN